MDEPRLVRIYVAGPYSAPTPEQVLEHVHAALDAALVLIERGYVPFVPHLTHWLEKRAVRTRGHGLAYAWWLAYDRLWLQHCDALLLLAPSPGATREAAWACEAGLPVYDSLEAVPPLATAWTPLEPDPYPALLAAARRYRAAHEAACAAWTAWRALATYQPADGAVLPGPEGTAPYAAAVAAETVRRAARAALFALAGAGEA